MNKKQKTYRLLFLTLSLSHFLTFSFAQQPAAGYKPPVTIYLKDRPAPQTITIPLTPAQAGISQVVTQHFASLWAFFVG